MSCTSGALGLLKVSPVREMHRNDYVSPDTNAKPHITVNRTIRLVYLSRMVIIPYHIRMILGEVWR